MDNNQREVTRWPRISQQNLVGFTVSAPSYPRAPEINPAQRNICQQQKEGGNKEGSPEVDPENDRLFGRAKCVFGWGIESTAGHRRELGQTGFVSVMNEVFLRIGNHGAGHLRIHDLAASFLHDIYEIRSDIIRRKVKFIPPPARSAPRRVASFSSPER